MITEHLKKFKKRFLFVGRNSGFHGLNRLFDPNGNSLSRLFWLLAITLSIGGLYLMMEPVVELGVEINFTPDTRYLHWTTTFPGVTVCEEHTTKHALEKFQKLYPELLTPLNYNHKRYLTDLLYARGQCSNAQCEPCGTTLSCTVPWREVVERLHKSCEEMVSGCIYNGAMFPCCQYFRRVDSEHGPCYSFNSLHHKGHQNLFTVNRTTGPGVLTFRLLSDAEISIHSSEELSTNNLDVKMKRVVHTYGETNVDWLFSVVEIENDVPLQDESVEEKGCRFLHEVPDKLLHTYPVYSYGACRLAQSTEETFAHCGCVHPVRDLTYKKYYCNYTGMNCWNTFEEYKIKTGLDKITTYECVPSCVESELSTIHFSKRWVPEEAAEKPKTILVNVKMVSLPALRYQRNLRRTHLDLVVSVGGIAGLFFSASILSLLEVFYLIFRPQKFDDIK